METEYREIMIDKDGNRNMKMYGFIARSKFGVTSITMCIDYDKLWEEHQRMKQTGYVVHQIFLTEYINDPDDHDLYNRIDF